MMLTCPVKVDERLMERFSLLDGELNARFGWCPSVSIKQFEAIAEQLAPAGYRPSRVRPVAGLGQGAMAAIWTRDHRNWELRHGLTAEEVLRQDNTLRQQAGHVAS